MMYMRIKKTIFTLLVLMLCVVSTTTFAVDISPIINMNTQTDTNTENKLKSIGGNALAIIQVIGVSVALIMIIAVAVKYMTSAPNERAEIKKHLVPYIIGAILIFGSASILGLIRTFTEATVNK